MSGENVRHLHPTLKTWFDSRLLITPAVPFFEKTDPIKMLLLTALNCQKVTERGADNHGEIVELFQSTIGTAEGEPWCAAFIQSCVAYVESFGFTSGLYPSEHCLTMWENSFCLKPDVPKAGDIIVWNLEGTEKGHTGLITTIFANAFGTIEGNTGPATNEIERNGDGVYCKLRAKNPTGMLKILGFLRPF